MPRNIGDHSLIHQAFRRPVIAPAWSSQCRSDLQARCLTLSPGPTTLPWAGVVRRRRWQDVAGGDIPQKHRR